MKVPVPSIACFGRLAYPGHAEVTKHEVLGRKSHRPRCRKLQGGSDQGGEQTERPEHKGMAATSKIPPAVKSLERDVTVCRPIALLGKADVAGEVTGKCNLQTVVVGAQASWEGLAEVTSGRADMQQRLAAICKDSPTKLRLKTGRA